MPYYFKQILFWWIKRFYIVKTYLFRAVDLNYTWFKGLNSHTICRRSRFICCFFFFFGDFKLFISKMEERRRMPWGGWSINGKARPRLALASQSNRLMLHESCQPFSKFQTRNHFKFKWKFLFKTEILNKAEPLKENRRIQSDANYIDTVLIYYIIYI